MKHLKVSSLNRAGELLNEALGVAADTQEGVAELLRFEVSARGNCPRHGALRRVRRLAAPVVALDDELLRIVCDALEQEGDLVVAPGGLLMASPVRFVSSGDQTYRVFASLPSRWLEAKVPGQWVKEGVRRTCIVTHTHKASVQEAVEALGGVFLTAFAWAGLDRTPVADEKWIQNLENRLGWEADAPGGLERDGPLAWNRLELRDGRIAWSYAGRQTGDRLWRAKHPWAGWISAWTGGPPPSEAPFVRLSGDEAARTCFALARVLKKPVQIQSRRDGDTEYLDIEAWLPVAEYRYLSLHSTRAAAGQGFKTWILSADQSAEVREVLCDRLGVTVTGKSAT